MTTDWRADVRRLTPEQRKRFQFWVAGGPGGLAGPLAGWVGQDEDVSADELIGLLDDALDQHEVDDVDAATEGPRRQRDESFIRRALIASR